MLNICSACRRKVWANIRSPGSGKLYSNSTFAPLASPWTTENDNGPNFLPLTKRRQDTKLKLNARKYPESVSKDRLLQPSQFLDSLFETPHAARKHASRPGNRQPLKVRPLEDNLTLTSRMLSRALAERDLRQIDDLWNNVKASEQTITTSKEESGPEMTERLGANGHGATQPPSKSREMLFDELSRQFMYSYMLMYQPGRAFDVWNYMVETSRNPTLLAWHTLLVGCRKSRDEKSMIIIWRKLRSSGERPDVKCWRTRIRTLIDCGKPAEGIRALEEMGREWFESKKKKEKSNATDNGTTQDAVKPTIETINDTISGLINRRLSDAAIRVLTWGEDFGIAPDIVTFNILIRGLIRDGKIQSVTSLLAEMQSRGIQADVATFTTVLEKSFSTSEPLSPENQLKLINNIFDSMAASGVTPNARTYNRILYSLLSGPIDTAGQVTLTAVKAVLARMAAQDLDPTRDTYTMLVNHFFSQDPPDLGAVRSLLDRIRISSQGSSSTLGGVDHIFWDRVIEGYAMVGDTTSALAILGRVDSRGPVAGWRALEMLLVALVGNGELELAVQMVRNVKADRGGPPREMERGIEGQHRFWREVERLGLMNS